MAKRKTLSKKIRFEVFKRDKFTCQYCGKSAPNVILHIDHIKPVSKGGTNDIMNLITSCSECNLGKGARELSDDSVIKKQERQIQELAEKNEQLEMLLKWREELQKFNDKEVDAVNNRINEISGYIANDYGKKKLKKIIKEFSIQAVLDAVDIAFDTYYDGSGQSWLNAFNKIGGICHNRSQKRSDKVYYFNYICKACENKYIYHSDRLIRYVVDSFVDDDESFERVKFIIKTSRNWSTFRKNIAEEFKGDGDL